MASNDLFHLWKLHLIDSSLVEIRTRAAALDPGRAILAKIQAAEAEFAEKSGRAKELSGEQTDLELKQKSIDDKIKKFDKELYGGQVVNPREVAAIQKEISILKKQRGDMDVRILELWELGPPAKEEADKIEAALNELKAELREHQKKAMVEKTRLEEEFRSAGAQRSGAAAEVPAGLRAKYDAIRNRHGGIGMARIGKRGNCEMCGTSLPTKVIEDVKDDRTVTCEECHRVLYYSESII
jgi:predicted  nucleic acid-binding Zn-ribbon protein